MWSSIPAVEKAQGTPRISVYTAAPQSSENTHKSTGSLGASLHAACGFTKTSLFSPRFECSGCHPPIYFRCMCEKKG